MNNFWKSLPTLEELEKATPQEREQIAKRVANTILHPGIKRKKKEKKQDGGSQLP